MAIDPICKMTVDEKTAKFTSEFKGKKVLFLCSGLQEEVRCGTGEIRVVGAEPPLSPKSFFFS